MSQTIQVCIYCQKGAEHGHLGRLNDPDHTAPVWIHDHCIAAWERDENDCTCHACQLNRERHFQKPDQFIINPLE